jgi:hypothetical protein
MNKAVALCGLVLALAPGFARADTVRSEEYVAGFTGDSDGLCAEDARNPSGLNIGVVCIASTKERVKITIEDVSTLPVAGYYVFVNGAGAPLGSAVSFCGESARVSILPGTATVVVYIGGPALGPLACLVDAEESYPGIGTVGTVRASFST